MNTRLTKLLLLIGAVAVGGLFSGCIAFDRETSMLAPHKWSEIERNRANFKKLRLKMTKEEVLAIMGEPIKGEVFCNDEIVWWYYTRTCWTDYRTTRDECTPVVFDEDGVVVGWGTTYYRNEYDYKSWSDDALKKALKK